MKKLIFKKNQQTTIYNITKHAKSYNVIWIGSRTARPHQIIARYDFVLSVINIAKTFQNSSCFVYISIIVFPVKNTNPYWPDSMLDDSVTIAKNTNENKANK